MKHVSILLLHQANLAGFDNVRQGLMEANRHQTLMGNPEIFHVETIGLEPLIVIENGFYAAKPDKLIDQVEKTDIIIIPPVQENLAEAIKKNRDFLPWICNHYQNGAQVVSLCMGAFILASTGLLDGRNCVTHWRAGEAFRMLFPNVKLLSDKLLTDEDNLYTGGGAFSSVNLIIYLIEKMAGRETAIYCSKIFQVDVGRQSQSPFIIFKGQKCHEDEEVKKAQAYIEENYPERITVNELCDRFGVGRRTFERRFKKATANTVIEYIQRIRIEAAKKSLEAGQKTVNEVMYDVGYNDPKAFRDVFKKVSGMTPVDYRGRFQMV
ncbi:GlxA family transcriptional regulator [Negadavirga shengliensis]|uniref:GlxA family transcriptional regulator n=1 Tax=Negadavirga shengliensis TaxID=1389218 RepID=A0ABV9T087_9BACT